MRQHREALVPRPGETAIGGAFALVGVRRAMTGRRIGKAGQEPRRYEHGNYHGSATETHGHYQEPSAD